MIFLLFNSLSEETFPELVDEIDQEFCYHLVFSEEQMALNSYQSSSQLRLIKPNDFHFFFDSLSEESFPELVDKIDQ